MEGIECGKLTSLWTKLLEVPTMWILSDMLFWMSNRPKCHEKAKTRRVSGGDS